jgi:hypothetical protein
VESHHDLISLLEHDLFGKPVSTFPDHALNPPNETPVDFNRRPIHGDRKEGKGRRRHAARGGAMSAYLETR